METFLAGLIDSGEIKECFSSEIKEWFLGESREWLPSHCGGHLVYSLRDSDLNYTNSWCYSSQIMPLKDCSTPAEAIVTNMMTTAGAVAQRWPD